MNKMAEFLMSDIDNDMIKQLSKEELINLLQWFESKSMLEYKES
jgi:hypothetical protein